MKNFTQLTDRQKAKVQGLINKAYRRTISVVSSHGYENNIEKKQIVLNDSVDIYHFSVSNIIWRQSFLFQVEAMLLLKDAKI